MTDSEINEIDWRENRIWHTHEVLLGKLIKVVFKTGLYPLVDVSFIHPENLPKAGGCIVACNHVNVFDPFFLGMYLPRHPHFMAKIELFKHLFPRWVLRTAGTFPVNRSKSDPWALAQAGRVLASGSVLFMFPEGTRSGQEAILKRGKSGAVRLALEHQSLIVPTTIWGVQDIHVGLRNSNKISIRFDEPFDVGAIAGSPPHSHAIISELTDMLMRRIAAMLPEEKRGIYGN